MLEILSIHLFFILHVLLEMYHCWLLQIGQLKIYKNQLPMDGVPAVWSGEEWIYVQPFIDPDNSYTISNDTVKQPSEEYVPSALDQAGESFFKELIEVTGTGGRVAAEPIIEMDAAFDSLVRDFESSGYSVTEPDQQLTMDDWHEEKKPTPMKIKSHAANAQIDDYVLGEQDWVVEVVGEEQGYLHVSDGTARAWVNSLKHGAFRKGDILFMNVTRKTDRHVDINEIEILQSVSEDFLIPDEIHYEEFVTKAIAM